MADELNTIPELITFWSANKPDAEVFTFVNKNGRHCVNTAKDIANSASKFASLLRDSYGFCTGDVIANGLPNSPERLVTDMGILMAGCIMVNCQVLERDGSDFWNTARLAGCKGVLVPVLESSAPYRLFQPLLQRSDEAGQTFPHNFARVNSPQAPDLSKAIIVNRLAVTGDNPVNESFLDNLAAFTNILELPKLKPDDVAVLFATSGSSGFCKLVPRSHQEILDAARSFKAAKESRYFSDRPFGWMGGFPFDYLAYCSIRVLQDQYSEEGLMPCKDMWSVISKEKCTCVALVPVDLDELIREFQDAKPDYVVPAIVTSGQPLRKSLAGAIGLLTHAVIVAYSSTEASMVCAGMVTAPDQMEDFYAGKVMPGIELKIVDSGGKEVPPRTDGSVLVKSPRSLKRYFNQKEETDALFTKDGWLQTGDRGSIDEDGKFYCLGRSGDAVLQGSLVIYTSWPEGILAKCPDVDQVSVVAVPLPSKDRVLCACVVPRPNSGLTEEKLMQLYEKSFFGKAEKTPVNSPCSNLESVQSTSQLMCSEQVDARNQSFVIELKKLIFIEALPKTSTGKVNKKALVSLASDALLQR